MHQMILQLHSKEKALLQQNMRMLKSLMVDIQL